MYATEKDSRADSGGDIIADFKTRQLDKIDVSQIDASTHISGEQEFEFIGEGGFTTEGQIRVEQYGADTWVRLNTAGIADSEMDIRLKDVVASTLTGANFIR